MDFANERYVRIYTRDTATWKLLPWQGRALLPLILRKLDRAGVADLGEAETPAEAVAALVDLPEEVCAVGLSALLKRGVLVLQGGQLRAPRFVEAQECGASGAQRVREHRARVAAHQSLRQVTAGNGNSEPVTDSPGSVTDGSGVQRVVTPCLAVPSRTDQDPPNPPSGGEAIPAAQAFSAIADAAPTRLLLGVVGRQVAQHTQWQRAWEKHGPGASEAACKRLGAWIEAGGWGLPEGVPYGHLVKHLEDGLLRSKAWDGSPLRRAGGTAPAPAPTPTAPRPAGPSDLEPRGKPCAEGWCDGYFHFNKSPADDRNAMAKPCPKRGR